MMPGVSDNHPSIRFYDGDYPGTETSSVADNLDETISRQGLAEDVARFREFALEHGGPTLEIGCGTGRVLIPLARAGVAITGIDISQAMIDRLRKRLAGEDETTRERITLRVADAREYDEHHAFFSRIIIPFNGFSCIPCQHGQIALLRNAARLLSPEGRIAIDVVNPFALPLHGNGAPQPFFSRINPETGRSYTRFAAMGPIETDQTQRLFGWYDEIGEDGLIRRTPYELRWRLTFAAELSLMVETAGLRVESIEGDHRRSKFDASSPKIFMIAAKAA